MNCPICGAEVPEGAVSCPVCGSAFSNAGQQMAPNAGMPYQDMSNQGMPNQYAQYQGVPNQYAQQQLMQEAPKSKKGLIIGIVAGVVAIAAIVAVLFIFVFKSGHDGKYECDTYSAFGAEFYLDVKGDKFDMVMSYEGEEEKESGTIKFNGDKVTLTVDGEAVDATYDKSEKTITMTDDSSGMEIVFTKK